MCKNTNTKGLLYTIIMQSYDMQQQFKQYLIVEELVKDINLKHDIKYMRNYIFDICTLHITYDYSCYIINEIYEFHNLKYEDYDQLRKNIHDKLKDVKCYNEDISNDITEENYSNKDQFII